MTIKIQAGYSGAKSPLPDYDFILRDDFLTAEAAPIASPRTCEPGPGTVQFVAAPDGTMDYITSYIAGGKIYLRYVAPNYTAVLRTPFYDRAAGLSVSFECPPISNEPTRHGWLPNLTMIDWPFSACLHFYDGVVSFFSRNTRWVVVFDPRGATYLGYIYVSVLRAAGSFELLRLNGVWKLMYVNATATHTPVAGAIFGSWYYVVLDSVRVFRLFGAWIKGYGLASQRVASAPAGATMTTAADALVEATWSAVTNETFELDVRRTDADNRWIVRCSQAGSTIKLIQRQAGIETERSSAAKTWTNGTSYRILVICDGEMISTAVDDRQANAYVSAAVNKTATGVKVSHAVSNLVEWPRVITGDALAELEKYTQ